MGPGARVADGEVKRGTKDKASDCLSRGQSKTVK